ncbi:nuclear transport factor 2 family protein [Saccharopolyspora sp. K220]|uniref:nuclear transport factor 2 family protein n=1 Tax=Saccharopolyspora soli TaxID=2926618 RepID=UPI001F5807AA|nr:nuclear transport factor 2 family protein [Saccharopolyspora soli]MCI2420115.1 nuclear transport factor 2 family protein [Saccharopolyspora soli]
MTATRSALVDDSDHVQLERLALEVNYCVDDGIAETIPELFTEDGALATFGEPAVGHDALRAWGRMMDTEKPLAGVRHVLSNFRFLGDGLDAAVGTVYVTAFLPGARSGRATLPVPWAFAPTATAARRKAGRSSPAFSTPLLARHRLRLVAKPSNPDRRISMVNNVLVLPFTAESTADDVIEGVDLSGQRAVVTGGASGIGLVTARPLSGRTRRSPSPSATPRHFRRPRTRSAL